MSAVEDRLAATLAKHHLQDGLDCYRCTCGATTAKGLGARAWRERHLAAVIASSDDLAVIELPKPDDGVWSTECGEKVWLGENPEDPIVYAGTPYADGGQPVWHYPSEARSLAIATLAAAKTAEAVSDR